MSKGILAHLDKLRAELVAAKPEVRDYFTRGAKIVLGDSGIDPTLMLGVVVWAYLDMVEHAEQAVTDAILETVKQLSGVSVTVIGPDDKAPPKGELN